MQDQPEPTPVARQTLYSKYIGPAIRRSGQLIGTGLWKSKRMAVIVGVPLVLAPAAAGANGTDWYTMSSYKAWSGIEKVSSIILPDGMQDALPFPGSGQKQPAVNIHPYADPPCLQDPDPYVCTYDKRALDYQLKGVPISGSGLAMIVRTIARETMPLNYRYDDGAYVQPETILGQARRIAVVIYNRSQAANFSDSCTLEGVVDRDGQFSALDAAKSGTVGSAFFYRKDGSINTDRVNAQDYLLLQGMTSDYSNDGTNFKEAWLATTNNLWAVEQAVYEMLDNNLPKAFSGITFDDNVLYYANMATADANPSPEGSKVIFDENTGTTGIPEGFGHTFFRVPGEVQPCVTK